MAHNSKSLLALLLIFNILLSITAHAIAGRETPTNSNNADMKQPQFLVDRDGSFLVPGIGRFMLPRKGHGFNPFTYNPVTGTSGGGSAGGSSSGTGGGASHSYIPGGDDTPLPNPGVEVPNPAGSGGSSSTPSAPASP